MLSSLRYTPSFGEERRERPLAIPPELITALQAGDVPTLRQSIPRLSLELERARRHARPLSVAVLSVLLVPGDTTPAPSVEAHDQPQHFHVDPTWRSGTLYPLMSALLAPSLREVLRQVDVVTYTRSEAQVLVMLPETTSVGGRQALQRVQRLPSIQILSPLRIGVATFPDDGCTLEEILARAHEEWTHGTRLPLHVGGGQKR
jgi:hypothetical protein